MSLESLLDGTAQSLSWCRIVLVGLSLVSPQVGSLLVISEPQPVKPAVAECADTPLAQLPFAEVVP